MMDEKIVNLLKNQLWYLATCDGGEPNAVPVGFKKVADDGTLLIGDVFFKVTLKNLLANANVSPRRAKAIKSRARRNISRTAQSLKR